MNISPQDSSAVGAAIVFAPVDGGAIAGWAAAGQLYALIDGCVSPDVPALVEAAGRGRGGCLYLGWAGQSYRDKAPYLLQVDARMAEALARRFDGQAWGYFLISGAGFEATRRHLRRFIKVASPDGEGWLFRFHDPRLLPAYLRSSTVDELNAFFGPIQAFVTADGAGNGHMAYRQPELVQAPPRLPVGARQRMSRAHVAALRRRSGGKGIVASFAGMPRSPRREPQSDDLLIDNSGGGITRMGFGGNGQVDRITSPLGREWRIANHDNGKLSSLRLPSGLALDITYDDGNIFSVSRGGTERFRARHDAQNRLARIDFPDGTCHNIQYRDGAASASRDPQGRFITAQQDRLGRIERIDYQGDALAAVTDGNGNSTRFAYGVGRLQERQVYADGSREAYSFDPAGCLQQLTRADGLRIDISRNSAGQISRIAAGDGAIATFDHDDRGLLVAARNGDVELSWRYDATGRLVEERQGDQAVGYEYDAGGAFSGLVWPDGSTVRYARDADQRLASVTDWAGRQHTLDHAPEDAGWRMTSPEGLVATSWQDGAGLTTGRRLEGPGGVLFEQSYTYCAQDRLTGSADSRLGSALYEYDPEGQLLSARRTDAAPEHFSYDAAGNRTDGPAGAACFNALNQVVSQGGEQFAYDGRGNLVMRSGGARGDWRYDWDGFDRLVGAQNGEGLAMRYAYDALGRRISKTMRRDGSVVVTRYVWAGEQLIREIETASGAGFEPQHGEADQRRDFAYWPESYTPLLLRDGARICQYHVDPLGAPMRLTDAAGGIVWEAQRSGFGGAQIMVGAVHQPLRLPGQYHDIETGLHYNRLRYYDPDLGRYLSRDPLGAAGGLNLYTYVGNDPVNRADPLGLWWKAVVSAVAAVAVAVAIVALAPVTAPLLAVAVVAGAAAGAVGFGLHEALTQEEFCLSCILMAAAKGAVVGALTAVPFVFVPAAAGYAVYAGVGAGTGFLGYATDWAIDNMAGKDRPWNWKEAGIATGIGLVAGPAGKFVASRFGRVPAAAGASASKMSMADAVGAKQAGKWAANGRSNAARNGLDVSHLTDDQIAALHGYSTNEGYQMMNPALRGQKPMTPEIEAFTGHLDSGLEQLPSYSGTSYRGTSPPSSVLDQYQPGNIVSDAAPKSTAIDPNKAFGGQMRETVIGKNGKDISPFSGYDETEVLYPRNTKFEVLERVDNADGSVSTVVREVP